ncbi:MAG TPA: PQQ-dependent sugar dehydrogenase [Gammaproteobacteria bacterium]|nr:PQQ-dependent sugar dehydrogenase [Gammaproteobacteria bacterium]
MKTASIVAAIALASSAFAATAAVPPPAAISHFHAQCAPDNGGIHLPEGFCAIVVADGVGGARHLTVNTNGDIYVALSREHNGGGIAALRDTDGDGEADVIQYFGDHTGTGIRIHKGYLYFAPDRSVLRYPLKQSELVPKSQPQKVVENLPEQHEHSAKTFAFDESGHLYVNIGAPSNACQKQDRAPHSPGIKPCPLLKQHGGIWRFQADKLNQTQSDGMRFATGIRNAVAISWNPLVNHLYVVQMGRDQLHDLWPKQFTVDQSAELPGEEFFEVNKGDNFGWPYCYYDQIQGKKVHAPEYGGDGKDVGPCAKYKQPIMAFPGHWAPEALLFYTGDEYPQRYHGGAFIAFHGSWNRAPRPQEGYNVVFVPFKNGKPAGKYQIFASGFKGTETLNSPDHATYRPVGLAQGPDGSLYVSDSQQGRIWRIIYVGGHD